MTPTAPDLTAETRPMDLSAWPPAETDLYDAGVATLLASWERYAHGSGGATVHRDFYLQIEPVAGYSPLAPVRCARHYGRDCMRSPGHETGRVTPEEIFGTTFDAMVYRQYHDAASFGLNSVASTAWSSASFDWSNSSRS